MSELNVVEVEVKEAEKSEINAVPVNKLHELAKTINGTTIESLFFSATLAKIAYKENHKDLTDFSTTYVNAKDTTVEEFSAGELENARKHHVVNQYFIEDGSKVFSFNPHWGTDAQCHVWFHNQVAFLIFRGSGTEAIDFAVDSDVFPESIVSWDGVAHRSTEVEDVKVHGTIYRQFTSIVKYISAVLVAHKGTFKSITCTGHSLGGSIATLAAVYFSKVYQDMQISAHTFAATRVGNAAFSRYFASCGNLTSCRVYTEEDPSPQFPSNPLYVHGEGEAVCLSADGTFVVCYGDHNKRMDVHSIGSAVMLYRDGTVAHRIDEYIESLRKLIYIYNSKIDG